MYNYMNSIKFCGKSQKTAKHDINQAKNALKATTGRWVA